MNFEPTSELRPLRDRAKWAIGAIVVIALIDVVAVAADWQRIDLLNRILDGQLVSISEASTSDNRETAIGLVQLVSLIFGTVLFIRWFLNAYRNVIPLGGERRYGEKWAGWSWFVPFLNLWRPKQIANDIWRGSDPDRPNEAQASSASVSGVLTLWWIFWLLSIWAGNFAGRITFGGNTARDLRNASTAYLVGDSLKIVAAVLAVVVILKITDRQELRAARRTAPA